MKDIKIPGPVKVITRNADGSLKGKEEFSFDDFLDGFVWPAPQWRDPPTNMRAFLRCRKALAGQEEGALARVSDGDHEILTPIATMKGQRINPDLIDVMEFMLAISEAQDATEPPAKKGKTS